MIRLSEETLHLARMRAANSKLILISLRSGRLANRLVLFANCIAFAEEHGHRLVNVAFHSYADLFPTTARDIYCRYPVAKHRSAFDLLPGIAPLIRKTRIFYHINRAACVLNDWFPIFGKKVVTIWEIPKQPVTPWEGAVIQEQIAGARVVFAYGWTFRASPELVERHGDKIREFLRPSESVEKACDQIIQRLRARADVVIGVHVRQGDYRRWRGGKFFFPPSRFAGWMRELAGQFPDRRVAFFVCSDEPRTAEEFSGLQVEIGGGPPVNDLYTLARCDFILGPPSTFSQWASFHGKVPLFQPSGTEERAEIGKFRVASV